MTKEKIQLETLASFKDLSSGQLVSLCMRLTWRLFLSHPIVLFLRSLFLPYLIIFLASFLHGNHDATIISSLFILPIHAYRYRREQIEEAEEIAERNKLRNKLSYRLPVLWKLVKQNFLRK